MGRFLRITLEHDESTALYRSILNNILRILWLTEFPLFEEKRLKLISLIRFCWRNLPFLNRLLIPVSVHTYFARENMDGGRMHSVIVLLMDT